MLRASGVNYDIRKVDKYGLYERFPFRVPLGAHGDVFDRYMMRILEARESLGILRQALGNTRRSGHRPEGQAAQLAAESGRSLRSDRSAQRRTRFLSPSAMAAPGRTGTGSGRPA